MTDRIICVIGVCLTVLLVASLVYAVEQEEPAAAVVNGKRIPMSDLDREMQAAVRSNPELRSRENSAALGEMRQKALEYLINRELIIQEGKKAGLEPQDAEVHAEFAEIEQRFASQSAFEQALKQRGLTEEGLRGLIRRGLTVRKVLAVKIKPTAKPVTDKDVADFYEANKEGFVEQEKVSVSHILIKVSPDASDQEKVDAENNIKTIIEEARSGADFAELAKKYSQCPTASQGGDLGYFTRGQMVKPFEEAAFALQPGQISDIVKTQFGYHIIRVQDKKPERQLGLEEVSEQIKEALNDEEIDIALEKWLEPIREKATIDILLKG